VWILFLEKVIISENLRKALESSSPAWLPMARSIPVQSQILCDQTETDNWQYAPKLIAENQ